MGAAPHSYSALVTSSAHTAAAVPHAARAHLHIQGNLSAFPSPASTLRASGTPAGAGGAPGAAAAGCAAPLMAPWPATPAMHWQTRHALTSHAACMQRRLPACSAGEPRSTGAQAELEYVHAMAYRASPCRSAAALARARSCWLSSSRMCLWMWEWHEDRAITALHLTHRCRGGPPCCGS